MSYEHRLRGVARGVIVPTERRTTGGTTDTAATTATTGTTASRARERKLVDFGSDGAFEDEDEKDDGDDNENEYDTGNGNASRSKGLTTNGNVQGTFEHVAAGIVPVRVCLELWFHDWDKWLCDLIVDNTRLFVVP